MHTESLVMVERWPESVEAGAQQLRACSPVEPTSTNLSASTNENRENGSSIIHVCATCGKFLFLYPTVYKEYYCFMNMRCLFELMFVMTAI